MRYSNLWVWVWIIFSTLATGCTLDSFQNPLPVDVPNSYIFPPVFKGYWLNDEDRQKILIADRYFRWSTMDTIKIIRGVWPKTGTNGLPIEPPSQYIAEKYQHYDSLTKKMDTSTSYYITPEHVFELAKPKLLSKGYAFNRIQDSLTVFRADTGYMDMGKNFFIKDLGQGWYALNINTVLLGVESHYWQVALLKVVDANKFEYWKPAEKMLTRPELVYYYEEKYESYGYYDCQWTKKQLLQLLKKGYFDKAAIFTRIRKQ